MKCLKLAASLVLIISVVESATLDPNELLCKRFGIRCNHKRDKRACLSAAKNPRKIQVEDDTLQFVDEFGLRIYFQQQDFLELISPQLEIQDDSAPFVDIVPIPDPLIPEFQSSAISEVSVKLLDELFEVQFNEAPDYAAPDVLSSCRTIEARLKNDSVENCEGKYGHYQTQGVCLDRNNPGAGLAFRAMERLAEPHCTLDKESNFCELPSAREVSRAIGDVLDFPIAGPNDLVPNLMALFYAQFVVHDTSQGLLSGKDSGGIATAACGANRRKLPSILTSPYVEAIEVDCDDPFYSNHSVRCLNFNRNRVLNEKCQLKRAPFVNGVTPTMDLNPVYEWFDEESRTFKSTQGDRGKLIKDSNGNIKVFYDNNRQHTLVAAIHILFGKMHDLLVDQIFRVRPQTDETVAFETARKILSAFYQHIWYTELLVTFIGTDNDLVNSVEDKYDPSVKIQTIQEFSAAAGRFCHILVTDEIVLANPDSYKPEQTKKTRDTFGNVDLANKDFKRIIAGSLFKKWRTQGISPEIQNLMFVDKKLKFGTDLFAIDAQRERDACLQPYIEYLKTLGICIKSWDDLKDRFSPNALDALKQLYRRVEDIELYPAGDIETLKTDSRMGQIFTDITVKQFTQLQKGDANFYTHSLTPEQLSEVVKIDLKKFLCIAAGLKRVLKNIPFGFVDGFNTPEKCSVTQLNGFFDVTKFL